MHQKRRRRGVTRRVATTPAAYHPVVIRRILFAGLLVLQRRAPGPRRRSPPSPHRADRVAVRLCGCGAVECRVIRDGDRLALQASHPADRRRAGGVHDCQRIGRCSPTRVSTNSSPTRSTGMSSCRVSARARPRSRTRVAPATGRSACPFHFFTADGQFGSKDFHGQQVDDGPYRLEGDDIVVIGDQRSCYRSRETRRSNRRTSTFPVARRRSAGSRPRGC